MNSSRHRIVSGLILIMAFAVTTHAQVLLSVDWSNLSAVTITATGTAPAFSYNNGADAPVYGGVASSFQGEDGVTFVNFLTSASLTTGNVGPGATSSNLMDYSGTSIFDQFYVLSGGQGGSLKDLDIFANNTSGHFIFANGAAAFTGQAVFDFSAADWSDLVSRLPGVGASGNIALWNEFSYPLGTWTVTGAATAVPEPSTYAAVLGGLALLGALVRGRYRRRA